MSDMDQHLNQGELKFLRIGFQQSPKSQKKTGVKVLRIGTKVYRKAM